MPMRLRGKLQAQLLIGASFLVLVGGIVGVVIGVVKTPMAGAATLFTAPTLGVSYTTSSAVVLNWNAPYASTTESLTLYKDGSSYAIVGQPSSGYSVTVTCGEHSFYLKAVGTAGQLAYSNTVYATAFNCPTMTAPTLSGSAGSQTTINLSWNDPNTQEQDYKVYRGGSLLASVGANTTSYTDSGLTCGSSYTYYVQAYYAPPGSSANSNSVTVSTQACPSNQPPNAPSNFVSTGNTLTSISLSWSDNSTDETGFVVDNDTNLDSYTLGANTTSYTVSSLTCGHSYNFSVKAVKNTLVSSSVSLTASTRSCDVTAPTVSFNPGSGTNYSADSYSVTISASDASGISYIQYGTDQGTGTCSTPYTTSQSSVTVTVSWPITKVCAYAVDNVGNASSASTATYYLRPTQPNSINATPNYSNGSVTLGWWDTSAKEASFQITRTGPQTANFTAPGTGATTGWTTYTDSTCPVAGSYTYTVAACNAAGCSNAISTTADKSACDTTPPSGGVRFNPSVAYTNASSSQVDLGCDDGSGGTGCASYVLYAVNTGGCSGSIIASGSYTGPISTSVSLGSQGAKNIYAKFTDKAGNTTCSSASIYVDTTAPTGSVSINNGASTTSSPNLNLSITCSDNTDPDLLPLAPFNKTFVWLGKVLRMLGFNWVAQAALPGPNGQGGCQKYYVYPDNSSCSGTAVSDGTAPQNGGTTTTSTTVSSSYGTKYVSVQLQDGAGNTTCVSDSINYPAPAPTACTSVTVTNANADATPGYTKVLPTFQCNGSSGGVYNEYRRTIYYNGNYATQSIGTSSVTVPNYGDGTYTVYIEPHNSGGYASATSGAIYLDTTNPVAGSCSFNPAPNANGWINTLPVTASVTFTDITSGTTTKTCGINSTGSVSCTTSQTDLAGNTSSKVCTTNVDTTPPTASAIQSKLANNTWITSTQSNSNNPSFQVSITDSTSGISDGRCSLYFNNSLIQTASCSCSSGTCTASAGVTSNWNSGGFSLRVNNMKDLAGNTIEDSPGLGVKTFSFTVNNQAPKITVP